MKAARANPDSSNVEDGIADETNNKSELYHDNGVGVLTAADYFQCRLMPMLKEYESRSPILSNRLGLFHIAMMLIAAFTTILALIQTAKRWVPIVVAIGAALGTTLEWEQLQNRHRNVNQSIEELANLRTWWESLSMVCRLKIFSHHNMSETTSVQNKVEKRMPINKEVLVLSTEVLIICV